MTSAAPSTTLFREGADLDQILADLDEEFPGQVRVVDVEYDRVGGVLGFFAHRQVCVRYTLTGDGAVGTDAAADAVELTAHRTGAPSPFDELLNAAEADDVIGVRSTPRPSLGAPAEPTPSAEATNVEFARMLLDMASAKAAERRAREDDIAAAEAELFRPEPELPQPPATPPTISSVPVAGPAADVAPSFAPEIAPQFTPAPHVAPAPAPHPVPQVVHRPAPLPPVAAATAAQPQAFLPAPLPATPVAPTPAPAAAPVSFLPVEQIDVAPAVPTAPVVPVAAVVPATESAHRPAPAPHPGTTAVAQTHVAETPVAVHVADAPVADLPVAPSIAPRPAPSTGRHRAAAETAAGRTVFELRRQLVEIGVPVAWIPDGVADAYWVVEELAARVPNAANGRLRPGEVLAVVGPATEARRTAAQICARLRLDPDSYYAAGCPAATPERTLDQPWAVAGAIAQARGTRQEPVVLVVATDSTDDDDAEADIEWLRDTLRATAADRVWLVADATRKPSDTRTLARTVGRVDALAVTGAARTTSPASVWELDLPIALVDGRPSTRGAWAVLLIDKLAALGA